MSSDDTLAFEHYRALRRPDGTIWELGRGAMGVTYKAIDDNLHKVVALKVINALHVDKQSSRDRFLREARAAASPTHRNVAVVHHLGQNAQDFFYAMEFVDGETLDALVKRAGPRPWHEALDIVGQVARALAAAREKRLVHRDIKPANIMLVPELGEEYTVVKLIDFGLAKTLLEEGGSLVHTSASGFVGTPLYASPEQCNEDAPDIRSDIYSLGITLWFLLTGRAPFNGLLGKVFAQHLSAPPPWEQLPTDIPDPVRTVLARMLAKERADRPQNPADLRREIDACMREVHAPPPAPDPVKPTTIGRSTDSRLPPATRTELRESLTETVGAPPPVRLAGSRRLWTVAALAIFIVVLALVGYRMAKPSTRVLQSQARTWLQAALKQAPSLPDTFKSYTLCKIAEAQAEAGDVAGAQQTADSIKKDPIKAVALSRIAAAQARAREMAGGLQNFAAAQQLADSIKDDSTKGLVLANIAAEQELAGEVYAAQQNFADAKQLANSSSDSYKDFALRDIAIAQARAFDMAGARQTADLIKNDSAKASALAKIAAAQGRAGDLEGAQWNIAAARQTAESIKDDSRKDYALREIAAAQARASDTAGARRTADLIKGDVDKAMALGDVAAAQARASDVLGSWRTAGLIKDGFRKTGALAQALSEIAAVHALAGDFAAADATLVSIGSSGPDLCDGYLAAAKALLDNPSQPRED